MTKEAVSRAKQELTSWLESHRGQYEANGPLRKMGYNSPFVPNQQSYFEVQIPVRKSPNESDAAKPDQSVEE